MAHQQFSGKLQEEVICPICMDILQYPATIDCGHNFCLSCITQSGEAADSILKCPLCNKIVRRDMITPNWLWVNLVEKIQAMDPSEMQPEKEELRCLRHGEKCHYFCEVDGKFLCVVCCQSKDHKTHNATLIEEAAQSYQVDIWGSLLCSPISPGVQWGPGNVISSLWVCTHCPHLSRKFAVMPSSFKSLRLENWCLLWPRYNGEWKEHGISSQRCKFRFRLLNERSHFTSLSSRCLLFKWGKQIVLLKSRRYDKWEKVCRSPLITPKHIQMLVIIY